MQNARGAVFDLCDTLVLLLATGSWREALLKLNWKQGKHFAFLTSDTDTDRLSLSLSPPLSNTFVFYNTLNSLQHIKMFSVLHLCLSIRRISPQCRGWFETNSCLAAFSSSYIQDTVPSPSRRWWNVDMCLRVRSSSFTSWVTMFTESEAYTSDTA